MTSRVLIICLIIRSMRTAAVSFHSDANEITFESSTQIDGLLNQATTTKYGKNFKEESAILNTTRLDQISARFDLASTSSKPDPNALLEVLV